MKLSEDPALGHWQHPVRVVNLDLVEELKACTVKVCEDLTFTASAVGPVQPVIVREIFMAFLEALHLLRVDMMIEDRRHGDGVPIEGDMKRRAILRQAAIGVKSMDKWTHQEDPAEVVQDLIDNLAAMKVTFAKLPSANLTGT